MTSDNDTGTGAGMDQYILGQINANVASLLEGHRTQREDFRRIAGELHKRLDGHDARITRVEHGHWKVAGIVAALPTAAALAALIKSYLGG